MESFRIDVPQQELDDLRRRLRATRWPDSLPDATWQDGADLGTIRSLAARWADNFDWRRHETALNELPQFVTTIDGQRVHFVHERADRDDAVALLLIHGWPSSFIEFRHVVKELAHPTDPGQPAFHVVVPSLPGFGFSGVTTERGWGTMRIAGAFGSLMAQLGHDRYIPHGGDIGYSVAGALARLDRDHVAGIHLSLGGVGLTAAHRQDDPATIGVAERRAFAQFDQYMDDKAGYAVIQSTRAQTLAYGLTDSPAGQLAWIAEKVREWSDPSRPVDDEDLLTNVSVYWFTRTAGSAARFYRGSFSARGMAGAGSAVTGAANFIDVPTGVAAWPHEIVVPVRRWAEADYRIVYWADMPAGGHFAAMECPELLIESLRAFAALAS